MAMKTGYTVHILTDIQYLAFYCPAEPLANLQDTHGVTGGLNHLCLCVADLDAKEARVKNMGLSLIMMLITSLVVGFIFVGMMRLNLKLSLATQISPTPFAGDVLRRSSSNQKDI